MGQLFNRMGRLMRANVNSYLDSSETDSRNFAAGSAFATGGALAGASVGQVGILAAGTGFIALRAREQGTGNREQ